MDKRQVKILNNFNNEEKNLDKQIEKTGNRIANEIERLQNKFQREVEQAAVVLDDISERRVRFISKSREINDLFEGSVKPVNIYVDEPMMEITWDDGSKTRVSATKEPFDFEKGFAMAFLKRQVYGTKANYHVVKEYLEDVTIGMEFEETEGVLDLNEMSVQELKDYAKTALGITMPQRATKTEIVELIEAITTK